MNGASRGHADVLKWYPKMWRDRYGDELVALLDHTYGDQPIPQRARFSMMRAGSTERLRGAGFVGNSGGPESRVRAGSLLVLCAWALIVVAGSGFAKFAEHWDLATPAHDRALAASAFNVVQAAAAAGVVIFVAAALVTVPSFLRLLRTGGWAQVKRPLVITLTTSGVAVAATVGVVVWSHHFASSPLNNGLWPYKAAGIAWGIAVLAAIAVATGAIVVVASRFELSRRSSRALAVLALVMAIALIVIFAGLLTWWVSMAIHAPWFFGSGIVGAPGSPTPPSMIVFGALMIVGLIVGTYGASRVIENLGRISSPELG